MKTIVVQFDNSVDVSVAAINVMATVTIGTTQLTGKVYTAFETPDLVDGLIPHKHVLPNQSGVVNIPTSETGPAEPV